MLLNNAEVNNDVSATGVSSFTPDDISYRVQIGYYDDDPSSSPAKRLTSESELKNAKYAWVRSYGYINRYPNGRSAGTETSARRAMSAIYQFETTSGDDSYVISTKGGRLGMGFYAAAPNNERRTNSRPGRKSPHMMSMRTVIRPAWWTMSTSLAPRMRPTP